MIKTKAEFAYEELKKLLLAGEWGPNQRLVLNILTDKLDLSVMPIREALNRLEKEGFVHKIPHQGYSVSPMSLKELEDLMLLREMLTIQALPIVVKNITESNIADLYKLTDEMREIQQSMGQDDDELMEKFRSLNKLFHRGLVETSGITHLPDMLDNLLDLSNRYLNLVESSFGIREVDISEHRQIVENLESKDIQTLSKLIRQHYERVVKEFSSQNTSKLGVGRWVFQDCQN